MNEYKILFTGTMGAGKTTAIGAVSETPPIVTDVVNNDQSHTKERTTVGLDFGQFTLDSGDRIRMFGTPGQSRFDFLWKILSKNALGMIILTDNSRPDPLGECDELGDGAGSGRHRAQRRRVDRLWAGREHEVRAYPAPGRPRSLMSPGVSSAGGVSSLVLIGVGLPGAGGTFSVWRAWVMTSLKTGAATVPP